MTGGPLCGSVLAALEEAFCIVTGVELASVSRADTVGRGFVSSSLTAAVCLLIAMPAVIAKAHVTDASFQMGEWNSRGVFTGA